MPKRSTPEIQKDVEEIVVVNGPKRPKLEHTEESVCTIDRIIKNLAGDRVFANALVWEYAHPGEIKVDTLTAALNDMDIRGNPRKASIGNQINRFWDLHSKYISDVF